MNSVELYRSSAPRSASRPAGTRSARCASLPAPSGMEELTRQAGWAKTFGLPLELISADEAQRLFPPMSTDGVLGAAYLPTDGYIDPSQLTFALAEGARRRGAEICEDTRVTAIERRRAAGCAGSSPTRATSRPSSWSTPAACSRPRSAASPGSTCRSIPMAHEYLITKPSGLPLDMPTMRDPSLLVYFRPRVGRAGDGRLRAQPRAVGPRRDPAGLQRQAARRGLGPLRAADGERDRPGADARGRRGGQADQRPGGVHARRRVHPRADRGARLLGRGGLLRPRPRGRRRHGPARRRVDRRGPPSLDAWEMDSRRFGAPLREPRVHARPHARGLLDLLRRQVPGPRARGRPAAARSRPTYARLAELGAVVRREVGLGARELVRAERARGRRVAAPARLGGPASGRRRSAPSTAPAARRPRCSTRRPSPRSRSSGEARRHSSSGCATTSVARDVGAVTYTQMLNERGGIECDFTVTRLAEDRFRIVTGTAFGRHDLAWIRAARARRRSVEVEDVTSTLRVPRALGAACRARSCSRSRPTSSHELPLHARARAGGRPRAVPRAAGHLRR